MPPRLARLLAALLDDGVVRHLRRDGLTVPADLAAWLADLRDLAAAVPPAPLDVLPPPAAWLDVATAAELLGRSAGRVRTIAATGQVRARRDGRRWLLAESDVAELVEAPATPEPLATVADSAVPPSRHSALINRSASAGAAGRSGASMDEFMNRKQRIESMVRRARREAAEELSDATYWKRRAAANRRKIAAALREHEARKRRDVDALRLRNLGVESSAASSPAKPSPAVIERVLAHSTRLGDADRSALVFKVALALPGECVKVAGVQVRVVQGSIEICRATARATARVEAKAYASAPKSRWRQ